MTEESLEALKQAVEGLHNCKAKYKKKTPAKKPLRVERYGMGMSMSLI
jgi:hypothetical protein